MFKKQRLSLSKLQRGLALGHRTGQPHLAPLGQCLDGSGRAKAVGAGSQGVQGQGQKYPKLTTPHLHSNSVPRETHYLLFSLLYKRCVQRENSSRTETGNGRTTIVGALQVG